jgi:hypothetical protein
MLAAGGGHDTVIDSGGVVLLSAGLTTGDLVLERSGGNQKDLKISTTQGGGASLTINAFFDSSPDWSLQTHEGEEISIAGLFLQQLNERANWSDTRQAALAQADFGQRLRQDILNRKFPDGGYALQADGTYRDSVEPNFTYPEYPWNYELRILESDLETNEEYVSLYPAEEPSYNSYVTETGQIITRTRQVSDAVTTAPTPIRFLTLEQFWQEFPGASVQIPPDYEPVYGQVPRSPGDKGTIDKTGIIGYNQMSPGTTQQVNRTVTEQISQTLTTFVSYEHIDRVIAGDADSYLDAYYLEHASIDAGAGDDFINFQRDNFSFGDVSGEFGSYRLGSFLYGNSGNDTLIGSDYDDEIVGGTGDDRLDGGSGADIYRIFANAPGWDTIFDSGAIAFGLRHGEVSYSYFFSGFDPLPNVPRNYY